MKNKKEILELIGNGVEILNNQMSMIRRVANQKAKMDIIKKYIDTNKEEDNFEYLSKLNLDEIRELLPQSYDKDLYNLKFYIKILSTSYSKELDKEEVKSEIRKILNGIFNKLNVDSDNHDYGSLLTALEDYKKSLESIYNKIEKNDSNFNEEEVKYLIGIIERIVDEEKKIELLIDISESILDPVEIKEEKVVVEKNDSEVEETLTENEDLTLATKELEDLFKKFDLDFETFLSKQTKDKKEEFIKYAKVSNVEDILNTLLNDFNISLNDKQDRLPLIMSKPRQIRDILLYSNSSILTKVLDVVRKEGIVKAGIRAKDGTSKQGINLDLLLEAPARFIEKKHRIKLNKDKKINLREANDTLGAANDFINNIYLLKEYGVKPIDLCQNAKVSIKSTARLEQAIKVFELYGVPKEKYTSKLSCLDSIHQADALDMFIELGRYDYILKNISRCQLMPDDPIFYRLLYALKYTTLPLDKIFTNTGNLTALIHGQNTKGEKDDDGLGIDIENKRKKVNQTKEFYGNEELAKEYDSVIDPLASDIELALSDPDSIIHVLDKNFLETDENGKKIYPNVYDFGPVPATNMRGFWEIKISRNKVLRLCNELMLKGYKIDNIDTIMYILTKNSILTEEEYIEIEKYIINVMRKDDENKWQIS